MSDNERIAEGLDLIAQEMDAERQRRIDGESKILLAIGDLRKLLVRKLSEDEARDKDFETYKKTTNQELTELRRKLTNGHHVPTPAE